MDVLINQAQVATPVQKPVVTGMDMAKIDAAAKEFEAVFLSEMMKPMFDGIKTDGMFGGGKGEEIFRGFMIQEYGQSIAESGRTGIADSIKAEMIRMQEEANKH